MPPSLASPGASGNSSKSCRARRLESLGYSTLFVPDHFHEGFGPIAALTTAAAATTTLKVAPLVLNTDLRHPAVLARELASIDVLSMGRLEVGLGAGYNPLDYQRSGIAMDPPGVRVDRLIEHATVLRELWSQAPTAFEGVHYRIDDLDGTPKPYTAGGPPLLIAGGGKRMLPFAAQHADIVGVNVALAAAPDEASARDALPASIDEKFRRMRTDAGERFDDLEFNAWLTVCRVTDEAQSRGTLEWQVRCSRRGGARLPAHPRRDNRGNGRPTRNESGPLGLLILHRSATGDRRLRSRCSSVDGLVIPAP